MTDKIILRDDPEAATPYTLTGWKSRNGFVYTDEMVARYAGCTHVLCSECGTPTEKLYTKCQGCRDIAASERFEAMPEAEWDGVAMVFSKTLDRYYSSPEEADDDLEDGQTLADLQLVICKPNYVRRLEGDYCSDDLPEDAEDVPPEVSAAMEAFNEAVRGIVLSWSPGKTRLKVTEP